MDEPQLKSTSYIYISMGSGGRTTIIAARVTPKKELLKNMKNKIEYLNKCLIHTSTPVVKIKYYYNYLPYFRVMSKYLLTFLYNNTFLIRH